MKQQEPRTPLLFSKPSSALIGPEERIVIPKASSRVDYEGESAIVIGRRARHTDCPQEHIFGYTCINDVTARDLQKLDPDWTRAKGFDTFAPIGPYIAKAQPSRVTTKLNGRIVQDSPLSDRVFGDLDLVRYISTVMTLEPGDVIATGTPSGIAPMKAGDVVEVEVDTVGRGSSRPSNPVMPNTSLSSRIMYWARDAAVSSLPVDTSGVMPLISPHTGRAGIRPYQIMVDNNVTIFFQGHDHIFARQELDGVIYQTLPEPANPNYSWENAEAYKSGDKFPNSGHVRVTVSPDHVTVDYIRPYLDRPDEVAFTYTVP